MNRNLKLKTESRSNERSNPQIMIMGGAIAGLNVLLMVFVSLYWTNVDFHTLITGKPL